MVTTATSLQGFHLSARQKGLWFSQRQRKISQSICLLHLKGVLDVGRLELSLRGMIGRHEILRTGFMALPGMDTPLQVISESPELQFQVAPAELLQAEDREAALRSMIQFEHDQPLDKEPPFVRALLIPGGAREHFLLLTLLPLAADSVSLGRLGAELMRWYAAHPDEPDDEAVQYVDFSEWQTEMLASEASSQGRAFWEEQLNSVELPLLPYETAEQPAERMERHIVAVLDADETRAVQDKSEAAGVALDSVLLGCWHTLLARLTGQPAFTLHCWFDGRRLEQLKSALGVFEHYLPISLTCAPDTTFGDVIRLAARKQNEAHLMQESFALDASETAITQTPVAFQFQRWPEPATAAGVECRMHSCSWAKAAARVTLAATVLENGSLELALEYARAWKRDAIERLGEQYQTILMSASGNWTSRLSELNILGAGEAQKILGDWAATGVPYALERSWIDLFESQAMQTPQAPAIVDFEKDLQFSELNAQANRLAHYLRARGVRPESRVIVSLERSAELIIGLLAVSKAGGAYIPLEPHQPAERLARIIEDCNPRLILTRASLVQEFKSAKAELVCIDAETAAIAASSAENPVRETLSSNLAYILYTSGSSGTPKGVMIEHGSLSNLAFALKDVVYKGFEGKLRVGLNATLAFDGSVKQMIQMAWGHTLYLVPEPVRTNPEELAKYIAAQSLDVLDCTPSMLRMLMSAKPGFEDGPHPRQMLVGGEALEESDWKALAKARQTRFVNVYGPTECTVDTTVCFIQDSQSASLGAPLPNIRTYVVDSQLFLSPIGVAGELCISGAGVGRGYENQPSLTAERFVPDPFSNVPGSRMYRTGDSARWHVDGKLQYAGRIDRQVKLRGYRIELSEIESGLAEHEDVQHAVAMVREDQPGNQKIVAYVIPRNQQAPAAEEKIDGRALIAFLQSKLPEYMIPSSVAVLESLPLTANGKVDYQALPAAVDNAAQAPDTAPQTPVQEILAGIWMEVLERRAVGITDNFFELGGHSLLATQVIARTRNAFGIELPLRALFETPTIAALALHVEQALHGEKSEKAIPLERVSREGPLPLSFAQQRLWFLYQIDPESTAYNGASVLRLKGQLNVEALEKSIGEIVRRHEVLRTSFPAVDGQPVQQVWPYEGVEVPYVDLSGMGDEQQREQAGRELAREDAERRFNLEQGPLLRSRLVRMAEQEHLLLVTMHHSIGDGWSVGVLVREFSALYEAFSRREPSPLRELPIQYGDYACWQRRWMTPEVVAGEMEFWRQELAGAAVLELPTDYPRPALPSGRGSRVRLEIGTELRGRLEEMSRGHGVTLFMTLLASFQLLLSRYSGQDDIVVGSILANRRHLDLEPLIGFFANTLVMRSRLEAEGRFSELLAQVRNTVLEAYVHQDLPFEKLVEDLSPERVLGQTPLFQALLVLQNTPQEQLRLPGLELSLWDSGYSASKFDMMLSLAPVEGGLSGTLEYAAELFAPERMERMVGHFTRLLEAVAARPEERLTAISLLSEDERRQIVVEWNQTSRSYPQVKGLHALVESQAEKTPDAVAVICAGQQVTYGDLNRRANQLAHYLRQAGVGRETLVGVCMKRTQEMVVGLLAVLKAGGAYVPLDPAYPPERLRFMFNDTGLAVLLTQQELMEKIPDGQARVLCVDQERAKIAKESGQNLTNNTLPGNLAYVIYTSGSTGVPKGVMITHGSATTLMFWAQEVFTPEQLSGVLASTSICFDLSVFELFVPLSWGGVVVLAENALQVAKLEAAGQIKLINTVPSAIAELLNLGEIPASATTVNLAGEALSSSLVKALYEKTGAEKVFNLYGPSEDTTYSTYSLVEPAMKRVPIGKPVANTSAYVLDAGWEPAPAGVEGELYLGGAGLARGYLNRPDLTAEKFVPNPFAQTPGERLYRTGDWARYQSNGELEFLRRLDHQVKLRGYRIELGEIEAALLSHPGVKQAVAIVREDVPGRMLLAAYVVARTESAIPSDQELRDHLCSRVPEYMVPGAFVALAELPLNTTGKINRKALPAPEFGGPAADHKAARTPVEEIVLDIWREVLHINAAGVHQSFFDVGGHSLLATRVTARIRSIFGVELPLRTIFERPTVQGIAAAVAALQVTQQDAIAEPPLVARKHQEKRPLSYAQQRLWFFHQLDPENAAYNCAAAFRFKGALDAEGLLWSINQVVKRHEVLRAFFPIRDGEAVQEIAGNLEIPMEVLDLSALPQEEREEEVRKRTNAEGVTPFDLTVAPLLRCQLLKLQEQEHVLLLTMHHIVGDGWSIRILFNEIAEIYSARLQGREPKLQELLLQYTDFACWQREWLEGEVLDRKLEYWKGQLANAETLDLPTDRIRSAVATYRGARLEFDLGPALTGKLKSLSRREGVTMFMTLVAGLQTLLGRYSRQSDVSIGTDIANRNRLETENLIGCFVNTLVLRTQLDWQESFRGLLKKVRQTVFDAYTYQDTPFEKVVEVLQPERDMSRTPLFQVMLALQNGVEEDTLELSGLQVDEIHREQEWAKFELLVVVQEKGKSLGGVVEYARDLFDPETIEQIVKHWKCLLEAAEQEPERCIGELQFLTGPERKQQVEEWNQTTVDYPSTPVQELFEQQAALRPEAPAVTFHGRSLSYAELNRRANRMGSCLRNLGVGPEFKVGVYLERTERLVEAMLAIMKAGGVYVPLDPNYPGDRLSYMVENAGMKLLITDGSAPAAAFANDLRVVHLDTDRAEIEKEPCGNLPVAVSEKNLAYVMYTSGSTGKPKGVLIEHRGMFNHLRAKVSDLQLTSADTVAETAPSSFDISVWQILAVLLVGGRVHIVADDIARDGALLLEEVDRAGVTVIETVPALLRVMLAEEARPPLAALRWMISNAEALPAELCEAWMREYPRIPLLNAYGPTECSDDIAHFEVRGSFAKEMPYAPLGLPLMNTTIYVLDKEMELVPASVAGELYIGGAGVGRGYWNRGGLTAEKFVPNPFSETGGDRLYRTGDVVRWRKNRNLEFVGRVDHQVKLRGFRIELGEIEAVLQEHPEVGQALVVVQEAASGENQLVAYVTPQKNKPSSSADIAADNTKMADWHTIWEEVYGSENVTINPWAWMNSYKEQPFPREEVMACVNDSVGRILALRPKRVLEIGCGTGLILSRVAPHCEEYYGTDFSAEALAVLRSQPGFEKIKERTTLIECRADDLTGIPRKHFDLVILNEIVQYFPSSDYLMQVLEQALEAAGETSCIFVGGVRNFNLLEAFRTSVELYRSPAEMTAAELRQRIQEKIAREKELLVAPELFNLLGRHYPQIGMARMELKGGRFSNELTNFRYDAQIFIGQAAEGMEKVRWLEWTNELNAESLPGLLRSHRGKIGVRGVPNRRTERDLKAVELIAQAAEGTTVREILRQLEQPAESFTVPPEQLWDLQADGSCHVNVIWPGSSGRSSYDVMVQQQWAWKAHTAANGERPADDPRWWVAYANTPLQAPAQKELWHRLREYLSGRLPQYMVPSAWASIDVFPLTPNGKIDRKALPQPEFSENKQAEHQKPRTETEAAIAGIWCEILKLKRVGAEESFFDLGGHSLLATRVMSRIRQIFGVDLGLRVIFEAPTVRALATAVTQQLAAAQPAAETVPAQAGTIPEKEILEHLDRYSEEELDQLIARMSESLAN